MEIRVTDRVELDAVPVPLLIDKRPIRWMVVVDNKFDLDRAGKRGTWWWGVRSGQLVSQSASQWCPSFCRRQSPPPPPVQLSIQLANHHQPTPPDASWTAARPQCVVSGWMTGRDREEDRLLHQSTCRDEVNIVAWPINYSGNGNRTNSPTDLVDVMAEFTACIGIMGFLLLLLSRMIIM